VWALEAQRVAVENRSLRRRVAQSGNLGLCDVAEPIRQEGTVVKKELIRRLYDCPKAPLAKQVSCQKSEPRRGSEWLNPGFFEALYIA